MACGTRGCGCGTGMKKKAAVKKTAKKKTAKKK